MVKSQTFNLDKMRSNIYQQLKDAYKEHPETLSTGAKAVLGILATTRYMDHYDAKGDMIADMATRLELAEKLMNEIESGTYKGPGEPTNMILMLVPMDMVETAERYTELSELCARMHEVLRRNVDFTLHEYEREHGLPLTDTRHPVDVYLDSFEPMEGDIDALLED